MMGKFDSEFLFVRSIRSIGQEILELNYDRAIAALYFPRLIQSTRVFVTVTPSCDLMLRGRLSPSARLPFEYHTHTGISLTKYIE